MSGPEPEWLLPSWVRLVRAWWAATGVSRADRAVLLDQLLQDLAAARAAGATVTELVATPPEVFADSCAAGLMSRSAGIDTASLLAVCLGSGMVAAGAAWFALKAGVQAISDSSLTAILDTEWFTLSVDLFLAVGVLAVMVGAVRWAFRLQQQTAKLAPRLAITLTGGSLIGFPLASAYGASTAYSIRPDVVGVEVLIMLTFLAVATVLAQRWARHRPHRVPIRRDLPA